MVEIFQKINNNYKALIVFNIAGKVLISIAFPQVVKSPVSGQVLK